jgi:hypothetical protein
VTYINPESHDPAKPMGEERLIMDGAPEKYSE